MDKSSVRLATLAVVAMLLVSSAGSVAAQSDEPEWAAELEATVDEMLPAYNEHAGDLDLGPLSLSGTTNVYVHDPDSDGDGVDDGDDGLATFHITMDSQNRITAFERGTSDDATRKLTTDRATLERIAAADNPAAAFRSAVANDDIVIAGEDGHFVESLKWTIVNAFKGLFL